jgi:serine protease
MSPRAHHPSRPPCARRAFALAALALALLAPAGASAAGSGAYAPNEVLVKYATATRPLAGAATARAAGAIGMGGYPINLGSHTRLLHLPNGISVPTALARLRGRRDVLWAVPDYRAHASGEFIPNDPGLGGAPTDWEKLQWNFAGTFGVNATEAWANVAADGAPGGRGVIVAVLDTGVAYANRGHFRRSPDFSPYEFVRG